MVVPSSAAKVLARRLASRVSSQVRPPMKQASDSWTENRNPRSDMPAQIRSGLGRDSGLGSETQSSKSKNRPW